MAASAAVNARYLCIMIQYPDMIHFYILSLPVCNEHCGPLLALEISKQLIFFS